MDVVTGRVVDRKIIVGFAQVKLDLTTCYFLQPIVFKCVVLEYLSNLLLENCRKAHEKWGGGDAKTDRQ